jgi:conjugative transfer signal peptidase TraF
VVRRGSGTSDAPLLAWGDALRDSRTRRRRFVRRAAALAVGIGLVGTTIVAPPTPRLVWNASASTPIGLYAVRPGAAIEVGDMVIAREPDPYRMLAARRRYLPANVPLVKRIAAAAGDEVCAFHAAIFVNGEHAAVRRAADGAGRPMPRWTGCIRLRRDQVFLLMTDSPASFDGRYFGITTARDVVGKARLLWRR